MLCLKVVKNSNLLIVKGGGFGAVKNLNCFLAFLGRTQHLKILIFLWIYTLVQLKAVCIDMQCAILSHTKLK